MPLSEKRRLQLDDIVGQMVDNNESDDDIQFVVDDFKRKYESEQKQQKTSAARKEPTQTEKYGAAGALFPATTKATERGGGFLSRAIAGTGDVLTLPVRAASAGATGLGYLAGGGGFKGAATEAAIDLSKTESEERGLVGVAQNIAYDPTSSPLLLGAGNIAKAGTKAPTLIKSLLKAGRVSATEAAASAIYQQSTEGKIDAKKTAVQAALGFGVGAGGAGIGRAVRGSVSNLLKNQAIRNIDISLRPGQYGRKIGYNHDNVVKYDLVGSPRETYEKAAEKLTTLQRRAKEIAGESTYSFNVSDIFDGAKRKLKATDAPEDYLKQIDLLESAKESYINAFGEKVNAADAMKIRTRIGEKSAFVGRTFGGQRVDPNADWKEEAYNAAYFQIKDKLHNSLGGELKRINKAQSEIIPIKQVAERRIPIAESNQRIGLSDLLTSRIGQTAGAGVIGAGAGAYSSEDRVKGALGGLAVGAGLAAGRRALGSPTATKQYYRLANLLAPDYSISPLLQRNLGKVKDQPELIKKILGNERGSINLKSGDFDVMAILQRGREMFKPAIKNPKTGEIITGFMHKKILGDITKKDRGAGDMLWKELFNDNIGKGSKYIGFVDKDGNFLSRAKAESIMEMKTSSPSLVQMFH